MKCDIGRVRDVLIDDYILYNYKPLNMRDYMSANELLYCILTANGVGPFVYDGRLRFQTQTEPVHFTCRIHDLAYACYHGFIKSVETWQSDLQKYLDWKNWEGLTMDHADGNAHNNTVWNLSLMSRTLNGQKSSITAHFKLPVALKVAYVDNEYRVQMIWTGVPAFRCSASVMMNFICPDAETFVDCLKSLSTINPDWSMPLKVNDKWQENNGDCWLMDIGNSLAAQNELAAMQREAFDLHTKGCLVESLSIIDIDKAILLARDE